ncbi:hypothetical protein PJE062_1747 [Pseudovibrio sp. JE062]|nr:hypothetical protein PJE062_1747 [Pseudovibrio sp. JE062]
MRVVGGKTAGIENPRAGDQPKQAAPKETEKTNFRAVAGQRYKNR